MIKDDGKSVPLLSIIIPVYNAEKTIGRTLESLENIPNESRELIELVLVDDGSTDSSFELLSSKKKALSSYEVIVKRQDNEGSSAARNRALQCCKGEWIFFLDSDDELAFDPIPYIKRYSNYSSLGFSAKYFRDLKSRGVLRPTLVSPGNFLDVCTSSVPYSLSNIVFKRKNVEQLFDEGLVYLEDWFFWVTNPLVFESMKVFYGEISVIIHSHGGNKSSNYKMVGCYRDKVAKEILTLFAERLSQKQRNNLMIQSQIGLVLQGGGLNLGVFLKFPCNLKLYCKLLIYAFLGSYFPKFDLYGR